MNSIISKISKVMVILGLFLFENLEGIAYPQCYTLSKLIGDHKDKLKRSKVYIAVTVHNQTPFIPNLRQTLESNVTELTRHGVHSHVIVTCDGIKEDFEECKKQFENFPLPSKKLEIIFNERDESFYKAVNDSAQEIIDKNLIDKQDLEQVKDLQKHIEPSVGLSLARWGQLNHIHKLMKEDKENNLSPYFCIFDGDDISHKDLVLLELLASLEIGADAVGPGNPYGKCGVSSGNILRCKPEDSTEILKRISEDVYSYIIHTGNFINSFACNLYAGNLLEQILSKGYLVKDWNTDGKIIERLMNPKIDFVALDPVEEAISKAACIFLPEIPEKEKYKIIEKSSFISAPFFNIQNEQRTLFYYMRHDSQMSEQLCL